MHYLRCIMIGMVIFRNLLSLYDCVEKCHSYVNEERSKKATTDTREKITMIDNQGDDLCCMIYEFKHNKICDYAIQKFIL